MNLGADFDTTALTAVFNAGFTTSNVNMPVLMDNIVEGREMFGLSLMSNNPQITTGPLSTATGVIVDSTSKEGID